MLVLLATGTRVRVSAEESLRDKALQWHPGDLVRIPDSPLGLLVDLG